mmetsp:Transcript_9568/g.17208  ORF Transcript_9568/g.17208 Transcript_9568/m.17208 type:complete len:427 (+) Transcript_9568:208-1488(+)
MRIELILLLTSLLLVATVNCFLLPPHQLHHNHHGLRPRSNLLSVAKKTENSKETFSIIVIGKIILDKYGNPLDDDDDSKNVTIGGGGPQAAWGACAGLAVRDMLTCGKGEEEGGADQLKWEKTTPPRVENEITTANITTTSPPPKQNVTFLAPIGLKNWTPQRTKSLNALLPMLHMPPILVTSDEHITPTINIWHDENEMVSWKPVNGSFGEEGADGLWRDRPSARDVLNAIDQGYNYDNNDNDNNDNDEDDGNNNNVILHTILEAGDTSAGGGLDALPFFDSMLMDRDSSVGIEPIVFPNEVTGIVSHEDTIGVSSLIRRVESSLLSSSSCKTKQHDEKKLLIVSPDRPCYDALSSHGDYSTWRNNTNSQTEFTVRDGANGSFVVTDHSTLDSPSSTATTAALLLLAAAACEVRERSSAFRDYIR